MVLEYVVPPDNKFHGANMGPTWVLPAPDGPHIGPMNLAIRAHKSLDTAIVCLQPGEVINVLSVLCDTPTHLEYLHAG